MKKVSVFIPCRNEVKNIGSCVDSIFASDYPEIEVIVVDGMSQDGTRGVLDELAEKYENFKYVDNPEMLTPYAFNYGVKNSTGDFIQIVGSRNILAKDYISKLVDVLANDPEIGCVGGDYQHSYESDVSRIISLAMESKFGVGGSNYRTKKESCYVDTVGIPMYRKEIFNELGLFDERLTRNQDDDFNYRVTQAGYKIYYEASAKTQYFVRGSFDKLFKQFSQYGYFKVFVNKKHKTVTTLRQLAPAIFLSGLVVGLFLSLFVTGFLKLYFAGIVTYLGLAYLTSTKFVKGYEDSFRFVYAILMLHVGYGFGYLKGILDFLILGKSPSNKMQAQTT